MNFIPDIIFLFALSNPVDVFQFQDIGWRKNSRKLVLYVAGASFHKAGEGKVRDIYIKDFFI